MHISCLAAPAGCSSSRLPGCPVWRECRPTAHTAQQPWAGRGSAAVQTQLPAPSSACQPDATTHSSRQVMRTTTPTQDGKQQGRSHSTTHSSNGTDCDTERQRSLSHTLLLCISSTAPIHVEMQHIGITAELCEGVPTLAAAATCTDSSWLQGCEAPWNPAAATEQHRA